MKIEYYYSDFIIGSCEEKLKLPILLDSPEKIFNYLKDNISNVDIYNYVNFKHNPNLNYERCGFNFWDKDGNMVIDLHGFKSNDDDKFLPLELFKKYSSKDFKVDKFSFDFLDGEKYSNDKLEEIAKEIFESFRYTIRTTLKK